MCSWKMSSSVRPHSSLSHVRNSFREQGRGSHHNGGEGLLCGAEWTNTSKLNQLLGERVGAGAVSTWGLGLRMTHLGKTRAPTFPGCTASDSQEGREVTGLLSSKDRARTPAPGDNEWALLCPRWETVIRSDPAPPCTARETSGTWKSSATIPASGATTCDCEATACGCQ